MCYYIIETRNGAMCIEGVFNADKAYQTFKSAGVWSTIPVIADPHDVVHKCAVIKYEEEVRKGIRRG